MPGGQGRIPSIGSSRYGRAAHVPVTHRVAARQPAWWRRSSVSRLSLVGSEPDERHGPLAQIPGAAVPRLTVQALNSGGAAYLQSQFGMSAAGRNGATAQGAHAGWKCNSGNRLIAASVRESASWLCPAAKDVALALRARRRYGISAGERISSSGSLQPGNMRAPTAAME